jgi:hypothetical protein
MATTWAVLFSILCFLVLLTHVFSLPANWALLVLALVWKLFNPEMTEGWLFFVALLGICGVSEILEHITQVFGSRRGGATTKGVWGAIIGAIVGSIVGAGFLFGVGAIPGAIVGAYGGALLMEMEQGRPFAEANRAAVGSVFGKVLGMVLKAGLGVWMMYMIMMRVWQ